MSKYLLQDHDWHIYKSGESGTVGEVYSYTLGDDPSDSSQVISFHNAELKDKHTADWDPEDLLPLGVNAEHKWDDRTDIRIKGEARDKYIPYDGLDEGH